MMVKHPERLAKVHLKLVDVVMRVGEIRDLIVIEGARSKADEEEAIKTGHSALTDPMHSKHVIDPVTRPLALAVDLGPDPLVWTDLAAFEGLAEDMKTAAHDLGVELEWGGDWKRFKDMPHFQLAEE